MRFQFKSFTEDRFDPFRSQILFLVFIAVWTLTSSCPGFAELTEGNARLSLPQSQLGQPFESPVFLVGHWAYGGGFKDQDPDLGYGGAMVFRPGSPINIFDGLMNWKAGMVVQFDYQTVPDGGNVTSLDLILRRYFNNRGDKETEVNLFLGVGSGISDIERPEPDDVAAGQHWSLLAEAGQEWFFKPTHTLFLKAQYRWMINAGRTWQMWSVVVGAGLSLP